MSRLRAFFGRGRKPGAAGRLVLIVDDVPAIRKLARRILEGAGYTVVEAGGGDEAVKLIETTPCDLLMADLDMPGMRGEEMTRLIRGMRPDLKVLYVSAFVDRLFDQRPVLWEGEAFLDKPFTSEGLQQAVSLLLDGTVGH